MWQRDAFHGSGGKAEIKPGVRSVGLTISVVRKDVLAAVTFTFAADCRE